MTTEFVISEDIISHPTFFESVRFCVTGSLLMEMSREDIVDNHQDVRDLLVQEH